MYKASPQPYGVILVKTLLKLYCNKKIFGFNVIMRSAQNMFEEIKMLYHIHGYREFHIVDDLFIRLYLYPT